jgi:hypothetical protein
MSRAITVAALLVLSASMWMVRLVLGPAFLPVEAAALLGADLVLLAAVSATGMLIGAARWAHRLGVAVAASELLLALGLEVDAAWVVAIGCTAAALVGLVGGWTRTAVRSLPPADAPPRAAVVLVLVMLAAPGLVALASGDGLGWGAWTVVLLTYLAAGVYARAIPGSLLAVRIGIPVSLAASPAVSELPAAVMVPGAIALAALAWQRGVRLAVRPLARPGRAVPVPPEIVPAEILDAAGIDEHGRRGRR